MRWLVALALAWATASHAETLSGVVIVVIDGDTVLFKPDHYGAASRAFLKLRLANIDAPERDQRHGEAATRALKALVLKQRVEAELVATDAYGRRIAHLRRGNVHVNLELVRSGHAWASSRPRAAFRRAQASAREARRGLWHVQDPTPPWVWRRERSAGN